MADNVFTESELVLGLIGAVGTDLAEVRDILENRLKVIGYSVKQIRITNDIIPQISEVKDLIKDDEYSRLSTLMDAGNSARDVSKDNAILALGTAAYISKLREKDGEKTKPRSKQAYIISSLKHPDEIKSLRDIYPHGFYLIGVHSDAERRLNYLQSDKRISKDNAQKLMSRDENENLDHGQRVSDAFHLSDFFVRIDGDKDRLKRSVWRLLGLLFGHPYITPTFDEYAMFLAFSASLRSADLSRQVGAVIANHNQIISTGANDCPRAGGGQYWPEADELPLDKRFPEDGRDFALGHDPNKREQRRIIDEIVSCVIELGIEEQKARTILQSSRISDLTEFGRVVHAEMDALLSAARMQLPIHGGTLYSTTFPCHNCAKHIVAAGIWRLVYIEPYPKSKAIEFHTDSIEMGFSKARTQSQDKNTPKKVIFEPFVGVGPRRFFDLFSLRLGSGYPISRKEKEGKSLEWKPEDGVLRLQMLPASYLELEYIASERFQTTRERLQKPPQEGSKNNES